VAAIKVMCIRCRIRVNVIVISTKCKMLIVHKQKQILHNASVLLTPFKVSNFQGLLHIILIANYDELNQMLTILFHSNYAPIVGRFQNNEFHSLLEKTLQWFRHESGRSKLKRISKGNLHFAFMFDLHSLSLCKITTRFREWWPPCHFRPACYTLTSAGNICYTAPCYSVVWMQNCRKCIF